MIHPRRAPVTPRAVSPETQEVIPLEEAVLPWAGKSRGAVEIVGGPGSGKTTALCHLAAVTPGSDGILFLDEPEPVEVAGCSAVQLVVYTAHFKSPEEIRKANLRRADLRGADIGDVDFYLVDLRQARCTADQREHFRRCGAILFDKAR